jgi:hypothetical protein
MPTLLSETDVAFERADLLRRVQLERKVRKGYIQPPERTPGLHLSGLLRYVAMASKVTARMDEIADEELPLRWAIGQAWEEFAASLYPDMTWQPGEVLNPVIMTCDGLTIDPECLLRIEEFKFCRAKKKPGPSFLQSKWLWAQQGMGYCLGYGTNTVCWHVMWAFMFPDPVYTRYVVRFDAKELAETARMIEINKAKAIERGFSE